MKAAVLRSSGGPLLIEDVELEPPRATELLVRVEAAGICHTELHYMSGQITCPLPIVLGHEGTGLVEAVGSEVHGLAIGQRVAFTWRPRCGQCEFCLTGRPVMCVAGKLQASSGGLMDGTTRLHRGEEAIHHFLGVSCFAELAVVSERAVVPLPSEVPAAVAAIAGCAVVTGVGAVLNVAAARRAVSGRPLVVFGAGGVGLSALMGARLIGAWPLIAVDLAAERLELAERLGASNVVNASEFGDDDLVEALRSLSAGGAEVAIDAVGSPATLLQAFKALRPGGTLVGVGLSSSRASLSLPINELVQQQKEVVGSLYGSANPAIDLPRLLALYQAGKLPLETILGPTYQLDDVNYAYQELQSGAVGRAILRPTPF